MKEIIEDCPECGSEVEVVHKSSSQFGIKTFNVICNKCNQKGSTCGSRSEAISDWNKECKSLGRDWKFQREEKLYKLSTRIYTTGKYNPKESIEKADKFLEEFEKYNIKN